MEQSAPKAELQLIISPLFQLGLMLISSLFLAVIIYLPYAQFWPSEPVPVAHSLSPVAVEKFGGTPVPVEVGIYMDRYSEFDMLKGEFVFSGIMWFEYDPALISQRAIEHMTIEGGQFLERTTSMMRYLPNGNMLVRYDVRIKILNSLNYRGFPFDDHRISFWISHDYLGPDELVLRSSVQNFMLGAGTHESGWRMAGRRVKMGYLEDTLSNSGTNLELYKPCVIFSLNYARSGIRYGLTIFLPMFLIFFMTLFTLSLNPEKYFSTIVGLSTGSVTGMLAYRFIIESMSPRAGYFMLSDYCFFLIFSLIFVIFFFNLFGARLGSMRLKILLITLHILFVISMAIALLGW